MDFSTQLDALQQHVADTKSAAQAAASESRDQLRQRIDQAQVDMNLAVKDAKQQAGEAAASARSKWAQMKTDAAARMDDLQAKIDKRAQQLDARAAGSAGRHRRPRVRRRARQGSGLLGFAFDLAARSSAVSLIAGLLAAASTI